MKQYKKYVIPYKSAFILGPIFMIVEVLGEIILPKLMSMIINYGCGQDVTVAAKGPAYIIGIGAAMIGTALLMMMGGVLGAYFAVKASVNLPVICEEMCLPKCRNFPLPISKNFQPVL